MDAGCRLGDIRSKIRSQRRDNPGRRVQVKATFKDSLTFRTCPDYYLGFKLYPDGRHEEIFNGPGRLILDRYVSRKGIGSQLLSFPLADLRALSAQVAPADRIHKREV